MIDGVVLVRPHRLASQRPPASSISMIPDGCIKQMSIWDFSEQICIHWIRSFLSLRSWFCNYLEGKRWWHDSVFIEINKHLRRCRDICLRCNDRVIRWFGHPRLAHFRSSCILRLWSSLCSFFSASFLLVSPNVSSIKCTSHSIGFVIVFGVWMVPMISVVNQQRTAIQDACIWLIMIKNSILICSMVKPSMTLVRSSLHWTPIYSMAVMLIVWWRVSIRNWTDCWSIWNRIGRDRLISLTTISVRIDASPSISMERRLSIGIHEERDYSFVRFPSQSWCSTKKTITNV